MLARKDAIYRVEQSLRRTAGSRRLTGWEAYVETEHGFEDVHAILSRTKRSPLPYGPMPVPAKDMNNFIGIGSGFQKPSPRMRLTLRGSHKDAEAPIEELWSGSHFRAGSWIVSTRLKSMLQGEARDAFEFLPIDTELVEDGVVVYPPERWLCDLTLFIPAIEQDNATVVAAARTHSVRYRSNAVGSHPFFRDESMPSEWVFCTHHARQAIKGAQIVGARFELWGHQS